MQLTRFALTVLLCWMMGTAVASGPKYQDRDASPERKPPFFNLDIVLEDLNGQQVDLARFRGKVVVLNFWASWCFPCRYELPLLQNVHDRFAAQGLVVVAIAIDDQRDDARRFQQKFNFSMPMLFDAKGTSKAALNVGAVPETYVIDRQGRLVAFTDERDGSSSVLIDDPSVWEGPAVIDFLSQVVAANP